MNAFCKKQITTDGTEQDNLEEGAYNPLIQVHLHFNYKLCQDIVQIANEYLSKDFHGQDLKNVKKESDNLVKNLLARIFQNIFPEKRCISKKEDNVLMGPLSFEITSPSSISNSTKLSALSDHNDLADSPGDLGTIIKESKKIQKQSLEKANKVKYNFSQESQTDSLQIETQKKVGKKDFWSQEEDNQLLTLLEKYGNKWTKIGKAIGGRTGKQVRERYLNKLRPDIKDVDWTKEEDNKFLILYQKFGNKWSRIANCLPGRTEIQIKNRFYTRISKILKTGIGSKQGLNPQFFNHSCLQESFHVDKEQSHLQEQSNSEKFSLRDQSSEYIDPQDFLCRWNDPKQHCYDF